MAARRMAELFLVRPLPPPPPPPLPPKPPPDVSVASILKRAGTTLAAESRASNVITQAATTINPASAEYIVVIQLVGGLL